MPTLFTAKYHRNTLIPYRLQNAVGRREGGRSERIFKSDSNKREITDRGDGAGRGRESKIDWATDGRTEEYPITAGGRGSKLAIYSELEGETGGRNGYRATCAMCPRLGRPSYSVDSNYSAVWLLHLHRAGHAARSIESNDSNERNDLRKS